MSQHSNILAALFAWIAQRPGLEPGNYISHGRDDAGRAAYRSEGRRITAQRHDAERLLAEVARTGPHSDEAWADAFRAYSGRLSWDGAKLDYCTGQYWPTEYRAVVCAVAASLLWAHARENMPEPRAYVVRHDSAWNGDKWTKGGLVGRFETEANAYEVRPERGDVTPVYGSREMSAGDYLRAHFRDRFGATLAGRWFS